MFRLAHSSLLDRPTQTQAYNAQIDQISLNIYINFLNTFHRTGHCLNRIHGPCTTKLADNPPAQRYVSLGVGWVFRHTSESTVNVVLQADLPKVEFF